jgi:hypothetical protein
MAIGAAIALASGKPMIYPRLDVKGYGRQRGVEGEFESGETAVVIDDLATTGRASSKPSSGLPAGWCGRTSWFSSIASAPRQKTVPGCTVFTIEELLELWNGRAFVRSRRKPCAHF